MMPLVKVNVFGIMDHLKEYESKLNELVSYPIKIKVSHVSGNHNIYLTSYATITCSTTGRIEFYIYDLKEQQTFFTKVEFNPSQIKLKDSIITFTDKLSELKIKNDKIENNTNDNIK